nr:immunoglobulin light chain junction region [Macaca mulatta]
CMQVPQTPHSF